MIQNEKWESWVISASMSDMEKQWFTIELNKDEQIYNNKTTSKLNKHHYAFIYFE